MPLTINVTQKHIDVGMRVSFCWCPVALAARDAGIRFPVVGSNVIFSLNNYIGSVPDEVGRWIKDYDAGRPVEPITFDLLP